MTQDTECLRYVTCVRVLHACARNSYSDIIVKNKHFFGLVSIILYICIVVFYYSFFDVLPLFFINSLSVARCSPTLPFDLLVMNIFTLC